MDRDEFWIKWTEFMRRMDVQHLDMLLDLCWEAWNTGDFGRSVDDEDPSEWGMDVPYDFPTGW